MAQVKALSSSSSTTKKKKKNHKNRAGRVAQAVKVPA
jgi:hypothetical protein